MEQFLLQLGIMSLQACVVIGIVFLVRLLFKKAGVSKKYIALLWLLPYLCMICPWKIEGNFGFWKQPESFQTQSILQIWNDSGEWHFGIEKTAGTEQTLETGDGITQGSLKGDNVNLITGTGNIDVSESLGEATRDTATSDEYFDVNWITGTDWMHVGCTAAWIMWLMGLFGMVIYSADAHLKLHTKLICCMKLNDNIYFADDITVPFVLGIRKPRIYLPTGMPAESLEYVIAHEKTHIRRKDPLKKMLAFGITCLHWFNPLAWVAFHFFGKDLEMACDEETVLGLGLEHRQDYATALLNLSSGQKRFLGAPLAFGEGSVKERILNIVKYKKTWRVVSVLAVASIVVLAVVFMTEEAEYATMAQVDAIMAVPTVEQDVYLTLNGQTAQLADEMYFTEVTEFLQDMKIRKEEESLSRAEDRPADVVVQIGESKYNFTADFSSVWCDNGVKPSFSYQVKEPKQLKAFLEKIWNEWQANGGRNVADVSFSGENYFSCTLPEGTWQNHRSSMMLNDIYSGYLIMGNFEEPAHGEIAAQAWYSAGGMGVGTARKESVEGSQVMKYEDGGLVSVGWFSNHSSISKVEVLEGCELPAVLYEGEHDLFTVSEASEFAKTQGIAEEDLDTISECWYVFFGQESSEYVYTVFLNKDYFSKEDVIELAQSVEFSEEKVTENAEENMAENSTETAAEQEALGNNIYQYLTSTLTEDTQNYLASYAVDSFENDYVKLEAVEGLSYVFNENDLGNGEVSYSISIYNQDYCCGCFGVRDAPPEGKKQGTEWDHFCERMSSHGSVEIMEHEVSGEIERYLFDVSYPPFTYGDTEWLVDAGVFADIKEACREERIAKVMLWSKAGVDKGYYFSLNPLFISEKQMVELIEAVTFKEGAFAPEKVPEWLAAEGGVPSAQSVREEIFVRENADRLTYRIEAGEIVYGMPEQTVALQVGENEWYFYAYDTGCRLIGTIYAGTVSEVEAISEAAGVPMEESAGTYYYEGPLFSEEQQEIISGRANTDSLRKAVKKYTQEILISKDGADMIKVFLVNLE